MGAALDDEGKFSVYHTNGGDPVHRFVTISHKETRQYIHLTPVQFLRLLEWGEGQRMALLEMIEPEDEEYEYCPADCDCERELREEGAQ